ncbi:MAG TPA: acetylxylan esterase, partial [Candidatus Dormibacteraeota bacterium]|nr:acetylxylan esterase [Candidatus Dormibacteraeota bacterium]
MTANLYIPQTGKPPYPAVLHPTGHSVQGKARAFYQTLSIGLVKSGFVVLTYDPLGQGERRLFYDPSLEDSKVGGTTIEHQVVGLQSLLAGESVARYMIWDAMRGIDLLESRPEVSSDRIGMAGCSGGGTLTAYVAALDSRLKAAAPACYITNWEEQLKGTGPQDAEQQFPDYFRAGLDHGDLILGALPKPYLMCSTEGDFFPLEGARQTFAEMKRLYDRLGMEDRMAWAVGPGGHGMPKNVREAIYGWMNHWLKGAASTKAIEPDIHTEFEEDLYSTPTGQVSTSLGGETASTMNLKRYSQLLPQRQPLTGPADIDRLRGDLRRQVLNLTRYEPSHGDLAVIAGEPSHRDGYTMLRLSYAAGGRRIPALLITPDAVRSRGRTLLYLDEAGQVVYEKPGSDLDQLARGGYTMLAVDPSGTGQTTPKWAGYSDRWFGADRTTWLALMVGKPLVGLHMDDILRGVDLLNERGLLVHGGCSAFAKGPSAVDLLFAATVDDRLQSL